MLKIEKTVLPSPEQWEIIIEGMRNPMNSWELSDSEICKGADGFEDCTINFPGVCPRHENWQNDIFCLGKNDLKLMTQLAKGGAVHAKYRRMIPVFLTINAPLYWWKEFDTYKVGTVANSCSTMHKITSKPIELSDFSVDDFYMDDCGLDLKDMFINVVADCEHLRKRFLTATQNAKKEDRFTEAERKHFGRQAKKFWKGLIQLLPTSYNQKRTVMLNYEVLVNIYHGRKNHKLDEWHTFCDWIEQLPYSELITGGDASV